MTVLGHISEIKRQWLIAAAVFLALLLLNFLCFGRTLGGYFLADDYVHVAYLKSVFSGHGELLWQNFYSNWLQTQGTQFYRPLISLTLALDYLIWGANAFGYHLTNILYQVFASFFLFLLTRRLLKEYGPRQANIAAFFTAALFAVLPLHSEVVAWIIGRVDGVCTAFYLCAFWLFVKGRQTKNSLSIYLGLLAFIAALLSKEMAITLPPVLFLYCLFSSEKRNWLDAIKEALSATAIFWAALLVYLGIRTLSLGTIAGGYAGSIGEGLNQSLTKRLFQDGAFLRVIYPFDAEIFSPYHKLRRYLHVLYWLSGITLVIRLLISPKNSGISRYVGFAFLWFVLAMIPTYQVFNLTANLQSSRFIYMGTVALCLLLVVLVFPLSKTESKKVKTLQTVSAVLLSGFLFTFAQITQGNNLPWVYAGREVRALRQSLAEVVAKLPYDRKLALLNLPQRIGGAHELYNASMLWILLNPPLTQPEIASRVATFEPMTYGDSEIFNASRLRRMIDLEPNKYDFYSWSREKQKLVPVNLSGDQLIAELLPKQISAGNQIDQFLASPSLNVSPLTVDFVDIELKAAPKFADSGPRSSLISLYWLGENENSFLDKYRLTQKAIDGDDWHIYRFPVSEHKSWFTAGNIKQLRLDLPTRQCQVRSIKLVSANTVIPKLVADKNTLRLDLDGVYRMPSGQATFTYDARQLKGASKVIVEISKPDSWFEHYSGQLRDQEASSHHLKSKELPNLSGNFTLKANELPYSAYYQVRIAAVDNKGKVIGYVSDPINLQVSSVQIKGI